jgi:Fic family protein
MTQFISIGNIKYPKSVGDKDFYELFGKLIDISGMLNYVDNLPVIPTYADEIKKDEKIKAIRGTTGIEGNDLDESEIRKVLENKGVSSLLEMETINSASVHEFIISYCKDNPDEPISEPVIKQIHALNTKGIPHPNDHPGQYRNFEINYGYPVKQAPLKTASDIEAGMKELVEWVNDENTGSFPCLSWVVKGILAHYAISRIHPFADGNGRTARAVEALIFCQKAKINDYCFYGIANYCYRNRNQYIEELSKVDASGDASDFLLFCITGFHESIGYVKDKITNVISELMFMDYAHELRRSGKITKKSIEVLDVLVKLREIAVPDYYKRFFTDRSSESKRRWLQKFLEFGLITIDEKENKDTVILPNIDILKVVRRIVR